MRSRTSTAAQLELALLLAAPDHRIFLVGDDDQSIYGWRLADVRRVLDLADRLPGLRRTDLVTNFRCPRPSSSGRSGWSSATIERFAKRIVARPGAVGRLILAPDAADDDERVRHVFAAWHDPDDGDGETTRAILARTNRELIPAAAVALELRIPFRAERLILPLDDPRLDGILTELTSIDAPGAPLLARLGAMRGERIDAPEILDADGGRRARPMTSPVPPTRRTTRCHSTTWSARS